MYKYADGTTGIVPLGIERGFVKFVDLNKDGKLDLVTEGKGLFITFIQNAVDGFNESYSFPTNLAYSNVAIGDVNNDGWQDIVVIGDQVNKGIYGGDSKKVIAVYINNQDNTFSEKIISERSLGSDDANNNIALVDFDGNVFLDVVVTGTSEDGSSYIEVYDNNDKQLFTLLESDLEDVGRNASLAVFDYNGDGKTDLFVTGVKGAMLYKNVSTVHFLLRK